jgi:hypothetical protein
MRQRLAQLHPAAVDAGAHRAELDAEGRRDLLVGEALDVAEHHGRAELRGQRLEGPLNLRVEMGVLVDLLGAGGAAAQTFRVLGQRLEPDALPAPDHVEEEVGGDSVQPALECPGRELGQRTQKPG